MAKYRVRLESPDMMRGKDKPHFRVTMLTADSEADARRVCEQREARIAAHKYDDGVVAELEQAAADAKENGLKVPPNVRARLHTHKQELPYDVVAVEEVS